MSDERVKDEVPTLGAFKPKAPPSRKINAERRTTLLEEMLETPGILSEDPEEQLLGIIRYCIPLIDLLIARQQGKQPVDEDELDYRGELIQASISEQVTALRGIDDDLATSLGFLSFWLMTLSTEPSKNVGTRRAIIKSLNEKKEHLKGYI